MTNHFDQQSCERFGPLISAKIDGELEAESVVQLEQHLAVCSECRERESKFGEIDDLVYASAIPANSDETEAWPPAKKVLPNRKPNGLGKSLMRWIPLAVAASVLVAFLVIALPNESPVNAEQVALPLAELEMITDEQRDNQARMLKTLELELRALKLDVGSMDEEADAEEKKRLAEQLDRLIKKVNEFGETGSYQETLF